MIENPLVDPLLGISLHDAGKRWIGRHEYWHSNGWVYVTYWLFGKPVYQSKEAHSTWCDFHDIPLMYTPLKIFVSFKE